MKLFHGSIAATYVTSRQTVSGIVLFMLGLILQKPMPTYDQYYKQANFQYQQRTSVSSTKLSYTWITKVINKIKETQKPLHTGVLSDLRTALPGDNKKQKQQFESHFF